jgi:hypothetical protein
MNYEIFLIEQPEVEIWVQRPGNCYNRLQNVTRVRLVTGVSWVSVLFNSAHWPHILSTLISDDFEFIGQMCGWLNPIIITFSRRRTTNRWFPDVGNLKYSNGFGSVILFNLCFIITQHPGIKPPLPVNNSVVFAQDSPPRYKHSGSRPGSETYSAQRAQIRKTFSNLIYSARSEYLLGCALQDAPLLHSLTLQWMEITCPS